jgi:hypothetical protein
MVGFFLYFIIYFLGIFLSNSYFGISTDWMSRFNGLSESQWFLGLLSWLREEIVPTNSVLWVLPDRTLSPHFTLSWLIILAEFFISRRCYRMSRYESYDIVLSYIPKIDFWEFGKLKV